MKYFTKVGFGIVGCETAEVFEAASLKEAEETAYLIAVENAESFGFYQDEEHFGDRDSVGKDYDEGEYYESGFLDYYVGPYVAEEHDMYL